MIFDEVWKSVQYYPCIMRVIQKGAGTGRRENAVAGVSAILWGFR